MRRRAQLKPEDYKKSQSKLLRQAALLGEYVNRQQESTHQQAGGHSWLVTQQWLGQEAADCSAGLADLPRLAPRLAGLLAGDDEGDDCSSHELHAPLPQRDLVPAAVSLSLVVADLLEAARSHGVPVAPAAVAKIEGHIATLKQELAAASERMGQLGRELGVEARSHAVAGRRGPNTAGMEAGGASSLEAAMQTLCEQHPLADGAVKQKLLEAAQQAEALHKQRHRRSTAACAASLAQVHAPLVDSADSGGGEAQQRCPEGQGSGMSSAAGGRDEVVQDGLAEAEAEAKGLGRLPGVLEEGSGLSGSDAASALPPAQVHGWTEDEQAAFLRIRQDCMAEAGPGASQGKVLERLHLRLPQKTVAQLREYWAWHKEARLLHTDLAQLLQGWDEERKSFLAAARALLLESSVETLEQAEAAAARLAIAIVSLQTAQALGEQQAVRDANGAQLAQQRAEELAQQAAEHEAQRARQERYRARMGELLQQYREVQHAKREEVQRLLEAEEALRQQEAAAEAVANRQRVEYRRQHACERIAAARKAAERQQMEEERRAAAMDRLRAQVAPAAERDPQRVAAPTQSSRAAGGARRAGAGGEAAFRRACGFTNDDILKDQRFKLYEALRRLNLHSYEYAREALAAARPAKPPRPDTLTTLQQLGLA